MVTLSRFAAAVEPEGAFAVLAAAKRAIAAGRDVIELEIGDSPFRTPAPAAAAGIAAIEADLCRYGPSAGLDDFRAAASAYVNAEFGFATTSANVVAGPGAKTFQQLFCETFLDPGDGALVFTPHFPTYGPNIARRGARMVLSPLVESRAFRPDPAAVGAFLDADPKPRAIFLNSPHNPTGGVATAADLEAIAALVRDRDVAVFSDEPYDQMNWNGRHHSIYGCAGMTAQTVAVYSFSKSFSMSGWRLGFAVCDPAVAEILTALTSTALSCVPPFVQQAGLTALREAHEARDEMMATFGRRVRRLAEQLDAIDGITCARPAGSFYVFPNVTAVCARLGLSSNGLAAFLLEGADDARGVACLGGEQFGAAGSGYLRLSCAANESRLEAAVAFIGEAVTRDERACAFAKANPGYAARS